MAIEESLFKVGPATPVSDINFCVIDTETTGANPVTERVIDVAAFWFRDGRIQDKFTSLVNPGRPIPAWITGLTGIDDDMVRRAPSFSEIAADLRSFLDRGVFTAHNAVFDFGFIREEFLRAGEEYLTPQVCTLRLARHLCPELPSRSLGQLCENFLIDIWDRHRAHGDAEATAYVLKELLRVLARDHAVQTWEDLQAFQEFGALDLPLGMDYRSLIRLPRDCGAYLFKDAEGRVVAKGRVGNIQRRVKTYFKKSNTSKKSNFLRSCVSAIEVGP